MLSEILKIKQQIDELLIKIQKIKLPMDHFDSENDPINLKLIGDFGKLVDKLATIINDNTTQQPTDEDRQYLSEITALFHNEYLSIIERVGSMILKLQGSSPTVKLKIGYKLMENIITSEFTLSDLQKKNIATFIIKYFDTIQGLKALEQLLNRSDFEHKDLINVFELISGSDRKLDFARKILSNDKVDNLVLSIFSRFFIKDPMMIKLIIKDPQLDEDELMRLAIYLEDVELLKQICNHPKVNKEILHALSINSKADPGLLKQIYNHPENDHQLTLYQLAENPKADLELLKQIYNRPETDLIDQSTLLYKLAGNPRADVDLLKLICNHPKVIPIVLCVLLEHPKADLGLLKQICNHPQIDRYVLFDLSKHPLVDLDLLTQILEHPRVTLSRSQVIGIARANPKNNTILLKVLNHANLLFDDKVELIEDLQATSALIYEVLKGTPISQDQDYQATLNRLLNFIISRLDQLTRSSFPLLEYIIQNSSSSELCQHMIVEILPNLNHGGQEVIIKPITSEFSEKIIEKATGIEKWFVPVRLNGASSELFIKMPLHLHVELMLNRMYSILEGSRRLSAEKHSDQTIAIVDRKNDKSKPKM